MAKARISCNKVFRGAILQMSLSHRFAHSIKAQAMYSTTSQDGRTKAGSVIHVDSIKAAPLRHYLYTMLEGTDPNQGRLKFTVVSEPMNEQEECEDVGRAFLDLRQLLLTGNDVIEQEIDVVSVDEEQEVVGKLKVSVEAAQALNVIYQEYHQTETSDRSAQTNSTEDEEVEKIRNTQLHVLDFDDDDSDL